MREGARDPSPAGGSCNVLLSADKGDRRVKFTSAFYVYMRTFICFTHRSLGTPHCCAVGVRRASSVSVER